MSTLGKTCSKILLFILLFVELLELITVIFSNFSSITLNVDSFKSFNKGLMLLPKKAYIEHKIFVPEFLH